MALGPAPPAFTCDSRRCVCANENLGAALFDLFVLYFPRFPDCFRILVCTARFQPTCIHAYSSQVGLASACVCVCVPDRGAGGHPGRLVTHMYINIYILPLLSLSFGCNFPLPPVGPIFCDTNGGVYVLSFTYGATPHPPPTHTHGSGTAPALSRHSRARSPCVALPLKTR